MKWFITILLCSTFFASCSNGNLTKKKALELLKKDYPKITFYSVFTGDPGHANQLAEKGVVKAGLVNIDLNSMNQCVFFTDKAKDMLLPTPDKDKSRLIQRVKTADMYIKEITGIKMIGENKAVVEFTTTYRNITPFARLGKKPIKEEQQVVGKEYFSKYTDGWRINKSNPLDYLME